MKTDEKMAPQRRRCGAFIMMRASRAPHSD
jgi:hypothetical protein